MLINISYVFYIIWNIYLLCISNFLFLFLIFASCIFRLYNKLDITLENCSIFPINGYYFEMSLSLVMFPTLGSICVIWMLPSGFILLNLGITFFFLFFHFYPLAYLYFVYVPQKYIVEFHFLFPMPFNWSMYFIYLWPHYIHLFNTK